MKYYFSKNYNVVWQNPCYIAWLEVCNVLGQISKGLCNPSSQNVRCKMEIPCHDILATANPRGLNIKLSHVPFQTNWTWYPEVHTFSFLIFTEKFINTQETFKNRSICNLTSAHLDISITGSQKEYETMLC